MSSERRLRKADSKGPKLAGLFLLGCLLFNYPLLALFNVRASIFGIPLVYAYLFTAWCVVIALAALIARREP